MLTHLATAGQTFELYNTTFRWSGPRDAGEESASVPLVREDYAFPADQIAWMRCGDGPHPWFGRLGDAYAWRFEGIADFLLPRNGRSLHLFVNPEADPAAVDFVLCRGVLPRMLHLRGTPCLHASAVRVGSAVVGFAGRSGSGKSTVAASLASTGYPLVTDDVLPLQWIAERSEVACGPGLVELRLYEGSARLVGVEQQLVRPGPGQTKGRWLPAADRVAGVAAPLQALYLLRPFRRRSERAAAARVGQALRPTEALVALIENSFWLHAGETAALASDMACFATVVRTIPIRPLAVELSHEGLAAAGRHIRRILEAG
jgi:hypothetical protein